MFELLTHQLVADYLTDDQWTVNEVFVDIPNFRKPKYSNALTELIKLCLMPEPWDRPSLEELELKIGARCRTITEEYAANPKLQENDRLYYKGSEINQMPPGDRYPGMDYAPKPSELADLNEVKNPFTDPIIYPHYPSSKKDAPDEEAGEAEDLDDNVNDNKDDQSSEGPRNDGNRKLILISDDPSSSSIGNRAGDPVIISDSDEEDEEGSSQKNEVNEGSDTDYREEVDRANQNDSDGNRDRQSPEGGSDESDNSDVRRRTAMKKVPGT